MKKKILVITGVIMFTFAVVANVQYAFSDYGVGSNFIGVFLQAQTNGTGGSTGGGTGGDTGGGGGCSASVSCPSGGKKECTGTQVCVGFSSPPNGAAPYVSCDGKRTTCS